MVAETASVIIPAYNAEETLPACLRALAAQTAAEVVVGSDCGR